MPDAVTLSTTPSTTLSTTPSTTLSTTLSITTMSDNSFLEAGGSGSGSKKNSLLAAFKRLGRRNSSKSTASTNSTDDKSPTKSMLDKSPERSMLDKSPEKSMLDRIPTNPFLAPSELPVPTQATGSRSRFPSPNSFSDPSPATQRPEKSGMDTFAGPSNEAPPAYSQFANIPRTVPADDASDESKYGFLATFDTIILIDDSGSMTGQSWYEVSQALASIAPIVTKYDLDGVDLFFLNHTSNDVGDKAHGIAPTAYRNLRTAKSIKKLMRKVQPYGGTMTGVRLNDILRPYLEKCEKDLSRGKDVKPLNLIVITDGAPNDEPAAIIIQAAKRLDKMNAPPYQLGIQFFQVGNERGAKEALEELDDHLAHKVPGGIRDIVDTVTWNGRDTNSAGGVGLTADHILKVVLGSVVKKLDAQRASGEDGRI